GYNIPACQAIAGSSFAAFSMQDATLTIHASSAYTVDSGGRFKGYGSSTIAESAAHHGSIPDCNPEKMVRRLWTGTCYSAWQGRGYIARGKTGMPDFWLQRGTTTIHGTSPYAPHRITFSQPSDGGIPAVAGTYTTSRYFAIYRLASVRGVTVRTVVTHSA
ncbi:MAG TPA: hypothetical protein VF221_01780, partial [Chloroflexota bacterium]